MDPFTLATGIVSILGFTIQVAEKAHEYASSLHQTRKTISDLLNQLKALLEVVSLLEKLAKDPGMSAITVCSKSVLYSAMTECAKKIQDLNQKLESYQNGSQLSQILRQAKWPFEEKSFRQYVRDLHAYTALFSLALSVQGCTMLSRTSSEVSEVLQKECQTLEETRNIVAGVAGLEKQINEQLASKATVLQLLVSFSGVASDVATISQGVRDLWSIAKGEPSIYAKYQTFESKQI